MSKIMMVLDPDEAQVVRAALFDHIHSLASILSADFEGRIGSATASHLHLLDSAKELHTATNLFSLLSKEFLDLTDKEREEETDEVSASQRA